MTRIPTVTNNSFIYPPKRSIQEIITVQIISQRSTVQENSVDVLKLITPLNKSNTLSK